MNNRYYVILFSIIIVSIAQVMLKKGAIGKTIYGIPLNLKISSGYLLLLISTLLNVYALQEIPLKKVTILLPLTFIFIGIFSKFILKEHFSISMLIGYIFILSGVYISFL